MATPSPQTWTLRLKSRKTTVLLHVDPLHTFPTIKSYLYDALQDTGLTDSDTGAPIPLPASPSAIQLGRPLNTNDAHDGFHPGEWECAASDNEDTADADAAPTTTKGKGKARARPQNAATTTTASAPGTARSAPVKNCPKGAGLKDGAVLAFRWVGDGIWDGRDHHDHDHVDAKGAADPELDPRMWGVSLATFQDTYGVDNEMDVGGAREFEG